MVAALDFDLDCILVDFHISVLQCLRGFDPVTEGEGITTFHPKKSGNPDAFPEANSLLSAAYQWVEEGGDRVKFRLPWPHRPNQRGRQKQRLEELLLPRGSLQQVWPADQCCFPGIAFDHSSIEYYGTTPRSAGPHDGLRQQRCRSSCSALQAGLQCLAPAHFTQRIASGPLHQGNPGEEGSSHHSAPGQIERGRASTSSLTSRLRLKGVTGGVLFR